MFGNGSTLATAQARALARHRRHHGQGVVEPDQRLHRTLAWLMLFMITVEDVDFQAAGIAQQARRQAATEQTTTQTRPRLADQHQAGAAFGGMLDQGFRHLAGPQQHHFAAEAFGQLLGTLQAQARLLVTHAAVVHMHQAPRQMPTLGDATGMTHQALGLGIAIDADQQATAHGRRRLAHLAITLGQVVIDLGGGRLHRQFAQGGEVGLGEKRVDRRPRLLRHVDLAVAQTLEQLARRQVDQQQFVGFLQHPVRQGFAHLHAGDAAHLIVEAFQVLDVDRGVHVDAGGEQFLNVLPAFFVTTAGGVGVGQFVHQHQLRLGREQTVEVHFLELHATVFRAHQRQLRQAAEQRFGFGAAMGFDHAGDDFHTLAQLGVGRLQHGVGLADTGRGAEENLEPATAIAGQVC